MLMKNLTRRHFLTLPIFAACGTALPAGAEPPRPPRGYTVQVALLWNLLRFSDRGTLRERIDHAAGTYEIAIVSDGTGLVETRIEAHGTRGRDRWLPARTR